VTRNAFLLSNGYSVFRFWNDDALSAMETLRATFSPHSGEKGITP
jgi:very-short-patch-repair endonuclease